MNLSKVELYSYPCGAEEVTPRRMTCRVCIILALAFGEAELLVLVINNDKTP